MTRDQLIAEFRIAAQDKAEPYLFEHGDIAAWLDEAQVEACIRGRLLHESASADVCRIALVAGQAVYPLHPALYELDHLAFRAEGASRREPVRLVSQEWLDERVRDWRDQSGTPLYAIQGDTSLRLVPTPDAAGELLLEGYRLPLASLAAAGTNTPEIHPAHHRQLIQWALYRGYSMPDTDAMDLERAALAERAFTTYFGARPDADLRRLTREDFEHHNKAWV